jgi:hypothetical protein
MMDFVTPAAPSVNSYNAKNMTRTIKRTALNNGLLVFENAVLPELIADFNELIDRKREKAGFVQFHDDEIRELILKLQADTGYKHVERFCKRLTKALLHKKFAKSVPDGTTYGVRCADMLSSAKSHMRHFDSHLMTLLIPLKKADSGAEDGDLILYRNRGFTTSTTGNVLRKTLTKVDQFLPLIYRRAKTARDLEANKCERIRCEIGNIYFFNGYALRHCNLSVHSGERRSLIVHAYDADNSWQLSNFLTRYRRRGK